MKHFDNIAEIPSHSPQVQPCEQSTREIHEQILADGLLAKYVKILKVRRKRLNKF